MDKDKERILKEYMDRLEVTYYGNMLVAVSGCVAEELHDKGFKIVIHEVEHWETLKEFPSGKVIGRNILEDEMSYFYEIITDEDE